MKLKHGLRRLLLGSLALAALAAPPVSAGCAAGFAPISQVDSLRVIAVVADKPYARPGDQVTFTMTYDRGVNAAPFPIEVLWLGGCYNPPGGQYYGCYAAFGDGGTGAGTGLGAAAPCPASPLILAPHSPTGGTDTFTLTLPPDLLSSTCVPPMAQVPAVGSAYVFFAVCAGSIRPVPPSGSGLAGDFPLGCFDPDNHPLGAESFVPGYTQVFAFPDGHANENPPVCSLSVTVSGGGGTGGDGGTGGGGADGGSCVPDDPGATGSPQVTSAPYCDTSTQSGAASGCGSTSAFSACPTYDVIVEVPATVAELDPLTGLYETVWVDYYADYGDIDTPVLLVSDAVVGTLDADGGYPPSPGFQGGKFVTRWAPPSAPPQPDGGAGGAGMGGGSAYVPPPETATIWAVVHDSRGGSTVVSRQITVSVSGAP